MYSKFRMAVVASPVVALAPGGMPMPVMPLVFEWVS